MSSQKVCYVSAFLNLNRGGWSQFSRTTHEYFRAFIPILNLFKKQDISKEEEELDDHLVLFMDDSFVLSEDLISQYRLTVYPISHESMSSRFCWSHIGMERFIMSTERFKLLVGHRKKFPEHSFPEYSMINHSKIDFIDQAMTEFPAYNLFSWVDFGYCALPERIPTALVDPSKLDCTRVTYTLINPMTEDDRDILKTLRKAPERMGGFFFFGPRDALTTYRDLYRETLLEFQNDYGITDDDQALAQVCYFKNPDLFSLVHLGKWHAALCAFQKTN